MKQYPASPPGFFLRFFRWFCQPELRDYIEGDLVELYHERLDASGKRMADWRFTGDVLLLFRPGIIRPAGELNTINNYDMFRNYVKVGFRNILKYKVFSFINVFGLALAMSVCMLIILMLADQKRYDAFHTRKERIYRILSNTYATTPYPLAAALKTDYPVIEETTSLTPGVGGDVIYQQKIADMRGYFADPSFFAVFSFELEEGNKSTALSRPNSMVISRELARRLFNDENPVGKTVEFSDRKLAFPQEFTGIGSPPEPWGNFTITGVIDESAYKSHLKFDVLVSSSTMQTLIAEKKIEDLSNNWEWFYRTYTYVLLQREKNKADLEEALNDLVKRKYADIHSDQTKDFKLLPQRLGDVQIGLMGNDTNNRMPRIGYYFLSLLALIIMISACLNYTNLSVARSLTRAKEIGVRKVTGANRKSLIYQFLSESMITALLALIMAGILLLFVRKAFMGLWVNKFLNFELPSSISLYLIFTGFALIIGILAGIYPALHLSAFQPIKALKNLNRISTGKLGMRKILSISQFVISLFFITTSILIYNQFKHFQKFDYGFNPKNIVNIELQGAGYQKLATELRTVPGVSAISACDIMPSTGTNNNNQVKKAGEDGEYREVGVLLTDENFIGNIGVKLIAGRNLPASGETSERFILVNEAAVKKWGYKSPSEIIGEMFETQWGNEILEVVGVVEDFQYKLLLNTSAIGPLMLRYQPGGFEYLNVKIASGDTRGMLDKLENQWKRVDPIHPFKYEFFEDQLAATHQGLFDLVSIVGFIAFLAITIACLGLLGMATYTAERKTREVGIRKILGAGEFNITLLLSKEFLKMLGISIGIGAPLSFFVNELWLQYFPNRVDFGFGTIFLGVMILIVLGFVTIGSQTIYASRGNPVNALKME